MSSEHTVAETLPLFDSEITAFRGFPDYTPSELMETGQRMLTGGPRKHMPYRNQDAPYAEEIMDTYAQPWVRELDIAGGNQVIKTTISENLMAYDARYRPSNAMLVMQDEATIQTRMRDNIIPMIEGTPFLQEIRSDFGFDEGMNRIKFANGHLIYTAYGTSENTTETWTIEYLYCDEPDFWPEKTGDLNRIRKRVVAYPHTHKIVIVCKPLTEHGPIWTAFNRADVRYYPHPVCLACDQTFRLTWSTIRWHPPDQESPEAATIERERLARMVCPHCGHEHDDRARNDAVRSACARRIFWQPDKRVDRPIRVAYHLPSMVSSMVSISTLAAEWIDALEQAKFGNIEPLKTFTTARLAEPWIPKKTERSTDIVFARCVDRPRGLVPPGALALAAAVDTQDAGLYYTIAAASNPRPRAMSIHLVREGFIPRETEGDDDFERLADILWTDDYRDAANRPFPVALTHQDAMGHRTWAAYDFAAVHPGRYYPIQGHQKQRAPHYLSTIDRYPNSNRPIPGGVQLRHLDVTYYQDLLDGKLKVAPGDPGGIDFHDEITPDFADQLVVCYYDHDQRAWIHPAGKPEHYWSCLTYLLAAFDVLGVKYLRPAVEASADTIASHHQPKPTKRPRHKRGRPW